MKKFVWVLVGAAVLTGIGFIPLPDEPAIFPIQSAAAQSVVCPNQHPGFTAGGNVFGRLSSQWNQYFASKVDSNNGVLCNPTVIGGSLAQSIPNNTVMGNGSGGTAPAIPLPVIAPLIAVGNEFRFNGACSDLSDDGTACTANVGISGSTLGLLDANKTDSGANNFTGTNSFATVNGTVREVSTIADTPTTSDCGKSIVFTSAATVTVTTFQNAAVAGRACAMALVQKGTGNVTITAGAGTTTLSSIGCTKALGQGSIVSLYVSGEAPSQWVIGGNCIP